MPSIISAAELTNADAIHPGYGFLSESEMFAEIIETNGFKFIGPSSKVLNKMGDKIKALILSPILFNTLLEGPINLKPLVSIISANISDSDRNPYPGCIASALVSSAALIIDGMFK